MSTVYGQARVAWTLREALLVILFISLIQGGISLLGIISLTNVLTLALWTLADLLLFTVGIYLFVRFKTRGGWVQLGLRSKGLIRSVLVGTLTGLLTAAVVLAAGWLIVRLTGRDPAPQPVQSAAEHAAAAWQIWLLFFLGSVLAPFKEELVYRGFLYQAMRDRVGVKWGILLTAIFFALAHADPVRFIPLLIGGIALNLVFERTGSLFSSIVAHGVWNGAMGIMVLIWR